LKPQNRIFASVSVCRWLSNGFSSRLTVRVKVGIGVGVGVVVSHPAIMLIEISIRCLCSLAIFLVKSVQNVIENNL